MNVTIVDILVTGLEIVLNWRGIVSIVEGTGHDRGQGHDLTDEEVTVEAVQRARTFGLAKRKVGLAVKVMNTVNQTVAEQGVGLLLAPDLGLTQGTVVMIERETEVIQLVRAIHVLLKVKNIRAKVQVQKKGMMLLMKKMRESGTARTTAHPEVHHQL